MLLKTNIRNVIICSISLIGSLFIIHPTTAQEAGPSLHQFNAQYSNIFSLYREAASYIRTENMDIAAIQLEEIIEKTNQLRKDFKVPPAPYDSLNNYSSALEQISDKLSQSLVSIDEGDRDTAWDLVSEIRKGAYLFQTQSGLYNLSTCIYDLNSAMDKLWPYYKNNFDIEDETKRNDVLTLNAEVAVWVRRCETLAPQSIKSNGDFSRLFESYKKSKFTIRESMEARDKGRFIRIMGEIRSLDRLIYLRFG